MFRAPGLQRLPIRDMVANRWTPERERLAVPRPLATMAKSPLCGPLVLVTLWMD